VTTRELSPHPGRLGGVFEGRGPPCPEELTPAARECLGLALDAARAGRIGRAIRCLEDALRRARTSEEAEFLSEADGAVRSAVAWRARLAAVAAHLEPREILLPSRGAHVGAEILALDVRGLRLRLREEGKDEERFVPYEDLPIDLLEALARGLVDSSREEAHRHVGVLRLLRGALPEAALAFAQVRAVAPRVDLSVEERLLEMAGSRPPTG
jgi:hypothetical protein